jgi:hypothetical protein
MAFDGSAAVDLRNQKQSGQFSAEKSRRRKNARRGNGEKGGPNNVIPFKQRTDTEVKEQITGDGRKVIPMRQPKAKVKPAKQGAAARRQQIKANPKRKMNVRDALRKRKQNKRKSLPPKGSQAREQAEQAFRSIMDSWLKGALVAIVAFPMWVLAVFVMNVRSIASLKTFRESKFGILRFSATNIFDSFNPKKKHVMALSPMSGIMVTMMLDMAVFMIMLIGFITVLLPPVIVSLGVGALLDPGIRAILLSFVGA